ncbi:hypothetical protein MMO39_07240 [Acinetobacter modestus]|uniref:hypothetical protein n=1 Tax=Acinetobacter modestus TaxID=1776740 RepID=UPI001F4A3DCE|nr:hypothetical protein [Acinetobacter modestus]MCH7387092.1 hypothetical protein [Acinetobacter modestus]
MRNDLIDVRKGLLLLEQQDQNESFDKLDIENKVNILNYALGESVSIYWPNLALNWIEKNPNILNDYLRDSLLVSIDKPWAKQDFKNKIRRVLRQKTY